MKIDIYKRDLVQMIFDQCALFLLSHIEIDNLDGFSIILLMFENNLFVML